jgi:hypothetical protein
MRSDGPTIPLLGWYDAGVDAASGEPRESETPTWPTGGARPLRRARGPDHARTGYGSALVLGVSLGANAVLFLGLLGLFLLGRLGMVAAGGPPGSHVVGAALSSPTGAASPTPVSGWLRVTPSSVQLGCTGSQRTQYVVVQNTGPQHVQWQATVAGGVDQAQAGVALSPDHGDLDAGASLPVQVQNRTHASSSQRGASQHGVIRFAATSAEAGLAPSLNYTAMDCP